MWPEFDAAAYGAALSDFARRQRRFGLTSEQITASANAVGG
jgi:undecaprenyl diphosphate synthase